jgi:hypothetical protein
VLHEGAGGPAGGTRYDVPGLAAESADDVRAAAARASVRGMPIRDQMRLQLAFLDEALRAV